MIYIVCFITSCIFFWLSEKCRDSLKRNILVAIAILIPCLLAGARADTIGTDVKVYVEPIYKAAKDSNDLSSYMGQRWFSSWRYKYVHDYEVGFTFMVYLIQKLGGSLATVLFFIQVLIIVPIYVGLRRIHGCYPICFCMFVFYSLFYNVSLNMMRQWIAMAILFMAFSYLVTEKKKRYCTLTILACLFHITAIMGFLILFVYIYSSKKREFIRIGKITIGEEMSIIKIFLYGCIVLLSLNIITVMLSYFGFSKYIGYIQGNSDLFLMPNQIIIRLPIIILFIVRWKKLSKSDKLAPFYGAMLVLDLLVSQLLSLNSYASRICYYFSEYSLISYSALVYAGNQKLRTNRYIMLGYIIVYLVIYWMYYYVITGFNETFPYVFA